MNTETHTPITPATPQEAPPPAPREAHQKTDGVGQGANYEERKVRFEERQQGRLDRLEAAAEKARVTGASLYDRAHKMGEAIPFGQPLLVGHHSYKRDRNYRERIHDTFGKAFKEMDKARHFEQKAAAVGSAGISSDDPDAIEKLREKLQGMEEAQEKMKAANRLIRKHIGNNAAQVAALVESGIPAAVAEKLIAPDFCGRIGFADYLLQNNLGNMHRVRERIAALEATQKRAEVEETTERYTYREDTIENRVMFIFGGKPEPEVRDVLKRYAFKWSPTRGAWVRQLSTNGLYAAKCVKQALAD
jgi:hypothetical protein